MRISMSVLSSQLAQLTVKPTALLRHTTTIVKPDGKSIHLFLERNPWKLSDANTMQRFFRDCVTCGTNRYQASWQKPIVIISPVSPYNCLANGDCLEKFELIPTAVTCRYFFHDGSGADFFRKHEQYLGITSSIVHLDPEEDDRVFANLGAVPEAYRKEVRQLEEFPAWNRIGKIDLCFYRYAAQKKIDTGSKIEDPFLVFLREYRALTINLLRSIKEHK